MEKFYFKFVRTFFVYVGLLTVFTLIIPGVPPCAEKPEKRRRDAEPPQTTRKPFLDLDISSEFVLETLNKSLGFSVDALLGKVEVQSKITGFLANLNIHVSLKSPMASLKRIHTENLSIELDLKNFQDSQALSLSASLKIAKANVYGLDLTNLTSRLSLKGGYLVISDLSAKVFDGKLVGDILLPIKPSLGEGRVKLQLVSSVLSLNVEGGIPFQNDTLGLPKGQQLDLQIVASSPELQSVLKNVSIEQALIPSGELVYLKGKISGPLSLPGFQGDFLLKKIKLSTIGIQQIQGHATYSDAGIQQVRMEVKNLQVGNFPAADILAELILKERHLKLTAFGGEYTAEMDLLLNPSLDYKITLAMNQALIEKALTWALPHFELLKSVKGVLSGQIASEGSLKNLKDASVDIHLDQIDLSIYDRELINKGPLKLAVTRQKLRFIAVQLMDKDTTSSLFVEGDLDFNGALDVGIDGLMDLRLLQTLIPRQIIEDLEGNAQVLLDIQGTYQNPEFKGFAELRQGFMRFTGYPAPLNEVTGKILFKKNQIDLVKIKGQLPAPNVPGLSGISSTLEANGTLILEGVSLSLIGIELRAQNIFVQRPIEAISIKTHANLTLTGKPDKLLLSGTVDILSAYYLQELNLQSLILEPQKRSLDRSLEEFGGSILGLDLEIKTHSTERSRRTIKLMGKSLDLNMRVDLKVRGTTNNPRIQGRIETTGGTLSFGNRTYRLTSGSLDFLDPSQINPDVTLQARTDIKDYQIFLTISGTLKDFSLSLSSDPPLPEKDITALLAFGGTSEQLFGIFGNLGAQQVVRLLIPPVQSQFGGRLEKLTRLDRFEVESLDKQDGTTSAIFTPQVVIGKEFFKDLFVTFSTTIGTAQEKQVVQLRYVISNRFSLIVERDNENQTNVSARMRFEFK